MAGKFISSAQAERDQFDWGNMGWISRPATTDAKDLVVIEVNLDPGGGHNFHKHPQQEEVIYVIAGEIEQWVEQEKQTLKSGDSVFIGADTVHASFNVSGAKAKVLAILGPCVTDAGYELVEVYDEDPWKSLRD